MMILDHATNIQIFDVNHPIVCDVVISYLVEEVIALVRDFLMCFGYHSASMFLPIGVFNPSTQYPLSNSYQVTNPKESRLNWLFVLFFNLMGNIYNITAINGIIAMDFTSLILQQFHYVTV